MTSKATFHIHKYKIASLSLALFILLITYKSFEPDLAPGLDSSYVWALNYLFVNDLNFLDKLVYPLGPLSFLLMPAPIGNNLYYATFFKVVLQLAFIFQILNFKREENQWWLNVIIALMAAWFATLDILILGLTFFLIQSENKSILKYKFVLIAFGAFVALLIKSSIGIAVHGMVLFFLICNLMRKDERKKAIFHSFLYIAVYIFLNLLYFQSFAEAFDFNCNSLRLASSYGDAMVLFPKHNSIFLWAALIITYLTLFYKHTDVKTALILAFPIFTMWKHSIVREDFIHARLFFHFLPFVFGVLVLQSNRKYLIAVAWFLASMLYYQNLKEYQHFKPYKFSHNRSKDFINSVVNIKTFNEVNLKLSNENLKSNVLNDSLLQIIGKETIDVYPNELSYIAANHLNWKPRVTLQSGAFGSWLDNINANDFDTNEKPSFILWHLNSDESGNNNVTFDNRLALNDEPITILTIIKNYRIRVKSKNLLLLEKLPEPRRISRQLDNTINFNFNEWIDVNKNSKELLRLHLNHTTSAISKLWNFIYKGNEYQLDYKLSDGTIISKRFVMDNAKDGLWINPFIFRLDSCNVSQEVNQLRVKSRLEESSEITGFYESLKMSSDFFNCNYHSENIEILRDSFLLFENNEHLVAAQGYSKTWTINVDSIWKEGVDSINVLANCHIRSQCNSNVNLVISFESENPAIWYKVSPNDCSAIDKRLFLQKSISRSRFPAGIIKVFVWNTGSIPFEIQEMTLNIKSIK